MGIPHKHAAIIKAWADGAEIEFSVNDRIWCKADGSSWGVNLKFRIKPARVFPTTSYSPIELIHIYNTGGSSVDVSMKAVANAAIKQYILDMEKK